MTNKTTSAIDLVERLTFCVGQVPDDGRTMVPVLIADVKQAADTITRLQAALEPFAKLDGKFADPVVEICDPHPDNPASRIQPFDTKHFRNARKAVGGE